MARSFQVQSTFLATKSLTRRSVFLTLPVGTVGTIFDAYDDIDRAGFVAIEIGGEALFTFSRDLRDCTYIMEGLAEDTKPSDQAPRRRPGTAEIANQHSRAANS